MATKNIINPNQCMSEPIESILEILATTSIKLEEVIEKLIIFYYKNHRHRYAHLSKFVLKKNITNQDALDVMLTNLERLKLYIDENEQIIKNRIDGLNDDKFTYDKFVQNVYKLIDHLELEELRNKRLNEDQKQFIIRQTGELTKSISKTTDSFIERTEKLEDKLNTGLISILGIFAAIIIAFFGGLNSLSSTLGLIGNKDVPAIRIVIFACLAGIIVFDIIFMFLYILSKLVKRPIESTHTRKLLEQYIKNKNELKLRHLPYIFCLKYPIFCFFNIMMMLIVLLSIGIYIIISI